MNDLTSVLSQVRDRVARYRGQAIGEENTKTALIDPVLRALGWDLEDLDEVRHEYRRKPGDNPVDYALLLLRTPRLFVEAKALGENLVDHRWAGQFIGYAGVAGVEWVAVTDGNEWCIYNAHATVPIEEKLFRRVVIGADEPGAATTLSLLSKGQLQDNQIDALWKSDFVDRQVRDALGHLFGPEPERALVRLIRSKAPALSPAEVRASLGRVRTTFDFPIVTAPAGHAVAASPSPPSTPAHPGAPAPPAAPAPGTPWRHVRLGQLIESGLVRPPLDLEHRYQGAALTARIDGPSAVVFAGATYDSLSTAGGVARRSVSDAGGDRAYPQTNGWTFWQYRRPDGTLGVLDELRQELFEGKVVDLAEARRKGA